MHMTPAPITWVRIGTGRCSHILAADGKTTLCGKTGKITVRENAYNTCDRCTNTRRSA